MEHNKRLLIIIVIGVLLVGNAFFGLSYWYQREELAQAKRTEVNESVIDFSLLFIRQVLQAESEVDFETRLKLENAVRDLKDDAIKEEWDNFTASKTELEAQSSVKKLLEILVLKIQK